MKKVATSKKLMAVTVFSVLLSLVTVVFGAPFLRVLRKVYGPTIFWLMGLGVTGAAWLFDIQPLAPIIGAIWMTLGAYNELEERGFGWWPSGVLSLVAGSAVLFVGGATALKTKGLNSYDDIVKIVGEFTQKVTEVNPAVKLAPEILAQQIPSALVILLILALGIGLIYERRAFLWLNLPREKTASQLKLLEYRVPDYFIWIAMMAFLLTMVSFGGKAVAILAVNIVNIAVVLYFFQGLAVLEVFLYSMRAGVFMRVLTYIILIGQLMLVLSAVGLIDYWVDFRSRIRKLMLAGNN